jgi:hypothetical protein
LPPDNPAHLRVTYTELTSKDAPRLACRMTNTYLGNLRGGQLRSRMLLSDNATVPMPTLRHHVGDVVGLSPKEEMAGIHTRRCIALMEHVQALGNGPVEQLPRNAMSLS